MPAPEHLHRACHPGLDLEPEQMLRLIASDELDLLGPRTDEAHLAEDNIEELWKLVEARTPEPLTKASDARVIGELEDRMLQTLEGNKSRWSMASASSSIVRNLNIRNGSARNPARSCTKKTGPCPSRA